MNTKYLCQNQFFNFEQPTIQLLIKELNLDNLEELEKVKKIYLHVRDGWRYAPDRISLKEKDNQASILIEHKKAHCIDKAIILITLLRAIGIPARIGLAKIKNHIAVEKILLKFGTEELTPHGYVDIYLNNKWVKATPAFDTRTCKAFKVSPLEFDGINDSIFHEYNNSGGLFMEYLEDYGTFESVPLKFIYDNLMEHYPYLKKLNFEEGGVLSFDS